MMKRLVALATLTALALSLAGVSALAEEPAALSVGTADAENGGQADVSVSIDLCAGVDSLQFNLNYDPTALKAVSVTPGGVFLPQYVVSNISEPGRVRVACIDAEGLREGGEVLTVSFRLLSGDGSAVTLTDVLLTRVDAEFQQTNAYLTIANGGVTADGSALPAPVITPWIPETPPPTPTPAPTPTPEASETPAPTAAAEAPDESGAPQAGVGKTTLLYGLIGLMVLLLAAAAVLILTQRRAKRGKRRGTSGTGKNDG